MAAEGNSTVTLLASGDIGPKHEPVDQFAELVLPILRQADLRFGQCERVYSQRASTSGDPSLASGPLGRGSPPLHPRLASVWKTAGIDVISVASNHTMDFGGEVLLDTIELFRGMGKHVIGGGANIEEARKPVVVERNGVKIAFLGYCSVLPDGHEAGQGKVGIAPMRAHTYYQRGGDPHEEYQPGTPPRILTVPYEEDLQTLQEDIRKARQLAHVVVMSIHWGLHHMPKTICDYQPLVAHAAIDAGADLILGHHPHILKAVEVYKGKVCFYSMGNFMLTSNVPKSPSDWNVWNFLWHHIDPECMPPQGMYPSPSNSRKTMIAKAVFSKQGVERVSFLPTFINSQAQPTVMAPSDPKFQEILDYVEWLSDQFPHKFQAKGNEVVVDALES